MKYSYPMPLLPEAMRLYQLGLSLIPMRPATKNAAVKWKRYQRERADEQTVRAWFADTDNHQLGIGVVLGGVSGSVLCRDFDRLDSYRQWTRDNPQLAKSLPTVETCRGRHVYFRCDGLPKEMNVGFCRHLPCGELRGAGHYVVAPPSLHPKTKQPYRWLVEAKGSIPAAELERFGIRAPASVTQSVSYIGSLPAASLRDSLPALIERTLPTKPGERNRLLFEFARLLKRYPEAAAAGSAELERCVLQWHQAALPVIRTKDFETTWRDFQATWPKIIVLNGSLTMAIEAAKAVSPPPEAERFIIPELRLLVSLCRELQRQTGQEPFFLGCRDAAALLGLTGHKPFIRAWRWLKMLCHVGILRQITSGTFKDRRANEYRYLGST